MTIKLTWNLLDFLEQQNQAIVLLFDLFYKD